MKKLYRNKTEYKIAGVCSGIGDYFKIDPIIIRLLFKVMKNVATIEARMTSEIVRYYISQESSRLNNIK